MMWKTLLKAVLFLMLAAMPVLGLQLVSAAEDSRSLEVGSWWTYSGTYRQVSTGSGTWGGAYTETGEYTEKVLVIDKDSDKITLSRQQDGDWSCIATGTWRCTSTGAQKGGDTWSQTYEYTIDLNTFRVIDVGESVDEEYVGHSTFLVTNVGQLAEGAKAIQYWWVPNSNGKGAKIADVDFNVATQTANVKGVELEVWSLSYTGDVLGWWKNEDGVFSRGSETDTYHYDPLYGILIGYSYEFATKGVEVEVAKLGDVEIEVQGDGWTEDYSEDCQLEDTNLDFSAPATPVTVQVTLNSELSKDGAMTVDGVEYASDQLPTVFNWTIGSTHTLEVKQTAEDTAGIRHVFVQWSDGSKDASRTLTATEQTSLTATFKTQYELTVTSDLGDPQGSGWYDANTQAAFSVTTPVTAEDDTKYIFDHWSGDSTADNPSASVLMDGPKTVKAEWQREETTPYTLIAAVVAVIALVVVVLLATRRKSERAKSAPPVTLPAQTAPQVSPPPPPPTVSRKFCIECGAPMPATAQFCAECGSKQQ